MSRRYWLIGAAILAATAVALLLLGRTPICTCSEVRLWVGETHGPGNSQHLFDWYTPSHVIHGFLFAGMTWWLMRRRPVGAQLCAALAVEAFWEVLENSPIIIDRYREATAAFGYSGDAIVNSLSDILAMVAGFWLARRLGLWKTAALGVVLELFTLWAVRDNLTLNILMLLAPGRSDPRLANGWVSMLTALLP